MKKLAILIIGVIIYLSNGNIIEYENQCFVLTENLHLIIYCYDYEEKGYNHPNVLTIQKTIVDKIIQTKEDE